MNEVEPHYIKELREDLKRHIDNKFETHVPKYFTEFKKHFDKKLEKEIGSLAISTANEFRLIREEMKGFVTKDDIKELATKDELEEVKRIMATKDDIKDILLHIGRYEVRALNIEHILIQDHKPRIIDLEKEVFS